MVLLEAMRKTERDLPIGTGGGMCWGMSSYDDTLEKLKKAIKARYNSMAGLADAMGIPPNRLTRWFSGERGPRYKELSEVFDFLGATVTFPGDHQKVARDIQWIDAKIVSAGNGQALPPADNYFAVPLVGEVGAGPGVMASEAIKSWVLVYKNQDAIRFKRDFLAVEIDARSTSMVPLLRPGDIVLVDRGDRIPNKPGGIFLVREPGQEGGAMVKRVATKQVNRDLMVTFYSDNAAENPADTYSLKAHYDDEISNAVVGRCVWAWSDLAGK